MARPLPACATRCVPSTSAAPAVFLRGYFGAIATHRPPRRRDRAKAAIHLRFEGNKLIGIMQFVSGASQMVITWDSSGGSCNASIMAGRDSGRAIQWKGVNGKTYTATGPVQTSNISCSIAAGNAFAGQ